MANQEHLAILRNGVDVWNEWREKNPDVTPDLSGLKLRNVDLRRMNLWGVRGLSKQIRKRVLYALNGSWENAD
ncbi:MAG: hypothetical protein AAB371_02285 [Patescibacteria group bacterium]